MYLIECANAYLAAVQLQRLSEHIFYKHITFVYLAARPFHLLREGTS